MDLVWPYVGAAEPSHNRRLDTIDYKGYCDEKEREFGLYRPVNVSKKINSTQNRKNVLRMFMIYAFHKIH